ncbi:zinc finger, RING/FYVE/PHD-type containing protein [Tanacetum coccineum]
MTIAAQDGFKLKVDEGEFADSEIIVLLGQHGTGKTTFIRLLKGFLDPNIVQGPHLTYKAQTMLRLYLLKVLELLCHEIDDAILDPLFVTQMNQVSLEQRDVALTIIRGFVTLFNKTAFVVEDDFTTMKGVGVGGRGLKDKQHGSASNTAKGTGVAFSTVDEHVNTPSINLEKPLEPNTGYHINDTANVEGPTTSNSTPITSASILESDYFISKLKGDMTRKSVNFCTLAALVENGADAAISLESVQATSEWFANTSYGFFLGKREAYPVKLHGVPMMAFSEDGLSIIATKLGTNERELKSSGKGSSHVVHGSSGNTPIIDKIDKLERQILNGKFMFVDDDWNLLVLKGNVDSGSDETKRDDDYDPYDEDLYESHDMSDHLQAIYENLDITVHGCYELLSISATVIQPSFAMLTTLSNNGGTNSKRKAQSPHTGGGGGSVLEARVQSPKSGGKDYGQNYDAQSSSAAMSLSKYT